MVRGTARERRRRKREREKKKISEKISEEKAMGGRKKVTRRMKKGVLGGRRREGKGRRGRRGKKRE